MFTYNIIFPTYIVYRENLYEKNIFSTIFQRNLYLKSILNKIHFYIFMTEFEYSSNKLSKVYFIITGAFLEF